MKMLKSKSKLILIAIIAIILIAMLSNISLSRSSATYKGLNWYTASGKRCTYSINGNSIALAFDNVYCVNHSGKLPPGTCFLYPKAKVEINGEKATFYSVNPANENEFYKKGECSGEFNNILAAILSEDEKQLGYGANSKLYYESQLALYYYWDSWVEYSEADSYGIGIRKSDSLKNEKIFVTRRAGFGDPEDTDNDGVDDLYYYSDTSAGTTEVNISELMNEYKQYARQQKYKVTIYCLGAHDNTSWQRVILVERGEPEPEKLTVKKEWLDGDNTNSRPNEIKVQLLANGKEVKDKEGNLIRVTLNKENDWYGEFTDLQQKDSEGNEIKYTVKEVDPPSGYKSTISEDASGEFTFKIINTEQTEVKVIKEWKHEEKVTTSPITVELYSNGKPTGKTISLDGVVDDKGEVEPWVGKFTKLDKYNENDEIKYTVKEIEIEGYNAESSTTTDENGNTVIKIVNTPTRDVNVEKKWEDNNNEEKSRPDSITVTLYKNGEPTEQKLTLDGNVDEIETEAWKAKFEELDKYDSEGNEIKYEAKETSIEGYIDSYNTTVDENGNLTIIITNTRDYAGYIEITGRVWLDAEVGKGNDVNGKYGEEDKDNKFDEEDEIKITLKDADGNLIKSTYTDANGEFTRNDCAIANKEDGTYTIRVNYDNSPNVYKLYENETDVKAKLKTAYVEFEYDGLKYTTVKDKVSEASSSQQSKAIEDKGTRNYIDNKYSTISSSTETPDKWTDKNAIAKTSNVVSFESYINTFEEYDKVKNDKSFEEFIQDKENKEDLSFKSDQEEVVEYCNGDGTHTRTNPSGAWEQPTVTNGHSCPNCTGEVKHEVEVSKIQNVNLGLFEREQPDVGIYTDLTEVEIIMNEQKYTYLYGVASSKLNPDDENYIKTKFQNKDVYTYQPPVDYIYKRPLNPADIAYLEQQGNNNADGTMRVFVTYEVQVGNNSTTLPITVNSITNAYDENYVIARILKGNEEIAIPEVTANTGFHQITLNNLNINVGPQEESSDEETIIIRYEVNVERIIGLFKDQAPLNNAVEINEYTTTYGETTLYAEQKTGERTNQPYAGYDYDSHPGNANIKLLADPNNQEVKRLYSTDSQGNIIPSTEVEDDTKFAPAFVLCKDDPKTLGGTVWEDTDDNLSDEERLGDGIQGLNKETNTQEKGAENVTIELHEVVTDEHGNVSTRLATLYTYDESGTTIKEKSARTSSNADGGYQFVGVVTGEYFVKYTYGDDTEKLATDKGTTMDGGTTTVNARNYKSTIITNSTIKGILQKDYAEFNDTDKMWHITHADGYSVAVDNMEERLNIGDLYYNNFDTPLNMTAYTKPFKTQVEFETDGESEVDAEGNIDGVTNVLEKLDFGIVERPREDLFIQKTITDFKIRLANGQELTSGNPSEDADINYVKAMGFRQEITTGEEARKALDKQLLIEIDAELTQGAELEVEYEVTVTNNNEIDYDYGLPTDYDFSSTTKQVYDKYITQNSKANYYYYGDPTGLSSMSATIEFVDYMDEDIVYNDNGKWSTVNIEDLHVENDQLISDEAYQSVISNKYKVIRDARGEKTTIARGEPSEPLKALASKVLANSEENVFDNNVEILKIDGKTARTIQEAQDGKQVSKTYKPGNYVPSLNSNTVEQDDDRVKIIITPPTGEVNYIITYVIAGLVGLIVMVIGVIFIKKKVLIK